MFYHMFYHGQRVQIFIDGIGEIDTWYDANSGYLVDYEDDILIGTPEELFDNILND